MRGFKPERELASQSNDHPCCDTIICVSVSTDDDLTINIKETNANDFYIDADENSIEEAGDEDLQPIAEADFDAGYVTNENMININSFQYDSNQVLDDEFSSSTRPHVEPLSDEPAKIDTKTDSSPSFNENEYYLEDKEYCKKKIKYKNRLP